jgi:site-specific DNA-methyltransferase (adenine-specific)
MIGELEINKIYCMDCIEGMKKLAENSIDSVVTDSPYELEFMGKKWDSSGIAFNKDMWLEVFRVLKPGGHLLSFGGTRTHHRMVCAIEDAGFDIRDEIVWIYGCGFPKSLSIGKAYDNKIGNEREVIGIDEHAERFKQYKEQDGTERKTFNDKITKGTSLYEGLGTSLKPAHEPIVLARKPFKGTVIDNVLKWGTGGINIDDCRIPTTDTPKSCKGTGFASIMKTNKEQGFRPRDYYENQDGFDYESNKKGRFPANLIHDGSDEVLACFPDSKSVQSKRGGNVNSGSERYQWNKGERESFDKESAYECGFNDLGNASRFFYCAKTSKSERNRGCEWLELKQNLQGLDNRGRTLEREDGSKTLVDRFSKTQAQNNHPTVKPLALMQYLVKLVTPKNGLVLDPFMGSGTTAIACKRLNFNFIGFDSNAEYCEIAKYRLSSLAVVDDFIEKKSGISEWI